MKAWVLNAVGEIEYSDVSVPEPDSGEVLVKVMAAGICGSDVQRVYENGAHKMPLIIGHEFAGIIEGTGDSADASLIGKRVGIFPLIPCMECPSCLAKRYEMCDHYSYLGSRQDGGFAEYAIVPKWNLIELPEKVSYRQAAMLEPMAVAVHAMRQLKLDEDMAVCICGLGTMGQLLMMFLMEKGTGNLLVIGNKDSQREAALAMGLKADNYYDINDKDVLGWISDKTGGKGVDAYYECVGKNSTVELGISVVAAGAQICLVGNPYGDMLLARDVYWKLLRRQITVKGTWNSTFLGTEDSDCQQDDWHYVLKLLDSGRIKPEELITHSYPLTGLKDGLEIMRGKTENYTKIMIENN